MTKIEFFPKWNIFFFLMQANARNLKDAVPRVLALPKIRTESKGWINFGFYLE